MVNGPKSNLTVVDNVANLKWHFHRNFQTAEPTTDLALSVGQDYDLSVTISGLKETTYGQWTGKGKMILAEPTNSNSGAKTVVISVLVSLIAFIDILA